MKILIKELHKELNKSLPNKNKFLINAEFNKEEMMIKFINKTSNKMNSFISKNFKGLAKITINCLKANCKLRNFKYNNFFSITLNLEKILDKMQEKNNFNEIDIEKGIYSLTDEEFNTMYCKKCLKKTCHFSYKCFYSLPNLLIISINRKLSNKYEKMKEKEKIPVKISEILNIDFDDETRFHKYCKKKYFLVGFLGRIENNGNESYFSVAKYQCSWILYEGNKINEMKSLIDYEPKGDIIMLFYQAI